MKYFTNIAEERLVKTYLDLISIRNRGKVTIGLICNKALKSRRTFYNHFNNLEDLQSKALDYLIHTNNAHTGFSELCNLIEAQKTIFKHLKDNAYQVLVNGLAKIVLEISLANEYNKANDYSAKSVAYLLVDSLLENNLNPEEIADACVALLNS